jgi:hypothetical protein
MLQEMITGRDNEHLVACKWNIKLLGICVFGILYLYIHGLLTANFSNTDFIPSSNKIFVNYKLESMSKKPSRGLI